MRLTHIAVIAGLSIAVGACTPEGGEGYPVEVTTTWGDGSDTTVAPTTVAPTTAAPTTTSTTTSTTTTTVAPLPTLVYTGTATKSLGCYGGLVTGNDRFEQDLGTDGWWDFGFQGCGGTESVALIDPSGGPTGNAFEAPTGYQCTMSIDGTSDSTNYFTTKVGSAADTGGLIFLSSSSSWPSTTTWRITCIPV